ncbi:MAG: hypothetical protein HY717_22355, partial [Planctomycetes bacterium]|nr:hypothetical protein [Planctomycetota bacterium]
MAAEPAAPQPTSYDRLIKACLQKFYPDLAAWLIGERPEEVRAIDPVLTSPTLRFADKLLFLKLKKNAPGLLHVEFQAEGDAAMPKRILTYIALLLKTLEQIEEEERQAIRPACVVIYLSQEGYRSDPGFFDLSGYLDFKLFIAYKVIRLWEVDPQPIFELESPGLLPFVPL